MYGVNNYLNVIIHYKTTVSEGQWNHYWCCCNGMGQLGPADRERDEVRRSKHCSQYGDVVKRSRQATWWITAVFNLNAGDKFLKTRIAFYSAQNTHHMLHKQNAGIPAYVVSTFYIVLISWWRHCLSFR